MSLDKKKPIKDIPAALLLLSLNLLENNFDKIAGESELMDLLKVTFDPAREVIRALSDSDPENKEQLKAIQYQFAPGMIDKLFETLNSVVASEIKDDALASGTLLALNLGKTASKLLVDNNQENESQLKAFVDEYKIPTAIRSRDIIVNKLVALNVREYRLERDLAIQFLQSMDFETLLD